MAKSLTPGIALGSLPNACGPGQPCAAEGIPACLPPPARGCHPIAPQGAACCPLRPALGPAALTPRRAFGGCWGEPGEPWTCVRPGVPGVSPSEPHAAVPPAARAAAPVHPTSSSPYPLGTPKETHLRHGQDLALSETFFPQKHVFACAAQAGKTLRAL